MLFWELENQRNIILPLTKLSSSFISSGIWTKVDTTWIKFRIDLRFFLKTANSKIYIKKVKMGPTGNINLCEILF